MKKTIYCLILTVLSSLLLSACSFDKLINTSFLCQHEWLNASCTSPVTCKKCGETAGEPLGHEWTDATCTSPKTCSVCKTTEGNMLAHNWKDATCTSPKTCSVCNTTEGDALGHDWQEATYTTPKTCSVCNKTEGSVLDIKLDYNYDLSEYITVGEYENVVIKVPQSEFDAAIKEELDHLKTEKDITDRPCALGDTISITFEGTLEGETKPFTGGTGSKEDFILGNGNFISGFEDAIVGHYLDEEFDIEVTFPEDYGNLALNGKKATFAIKITDLKEMIYPELTDELVKEEFKVDTLEKYKEELLNSFVNYSNVWSVVTDAAEVIEYPEAEAKYYKDYYYDSYTSYYEGIDFETVLSLYLGITAEQFDEYATSYAEQMIKTEMVMYHIARTENIELTAEEYQAGLKEYAEFYGYTDLKGFEEDYGKDSLKTAILMDEVTEFMLETATAVIVED